MDRISRVTLHYISGRQIEMSLPEAKSALTREEWNEGKPNLILIYENKNPHFEIYRNGQGYVFKTNEGIKEFESREKVSEDTYYDKLLEINVEHPIELEKKASKKKVKP